MMEGLFGFLRNWLFGIRGFEVLEAGTHSRPSGWYLFQCDIESVYSATQVSTALGGTGSALADQTRLQGYQIYGEFVEIVVTSGSVLAYPITSTDTTTSV